MFEQHDEEAIMCRNSSPDYIERKISCDDGDIDFEMNYDTTPTQNPPLQSKYGIVQKTNSTNNLVTT